MTQSKSYRSKRKDVYEMITQENLDKFKQIYKNTYKISLSNDQAYKYASTLLELYKTVLKNNFKEIQNENI